MRESYKLRPKDFIPIKGFDDYISRTPESEIRELLSYNKKENRRVFLEIYNIFLVSATLGGANLVLEVILI